MANVKGMRGKGKVYLYVWVGIRALPSVKGNEVRMVAGVGEAGEAMRITRVTSKRRRTTEEDVRVSRERDLKGRKWDF